MHHQVILVLCFLVVNTFCQGSAEISKEVCIEQEDTVEGRGADDDNLVPKISGLAELAGVRGVWWPGSHVISSWWSLLAAGLSSVALGAAVLPL